MERDVRFVPIRGVQYAAGRIPFCKNTAFAVFVSVKKLQTERFPVSKRQVGEGGYYGKRD
jgi:hypothetical protein